MMLFSIKLFDICWSLFLNCPHYTFKYFMILNFCSWAIQQLKCMLKGSSNWLFKFWGNVNITVQDSLGYSLNLFSFKTIFLDSNALILGYSHSQVKFSTLYIQTALLDYSDLVNFISAYPFGLYLIQHITGSSIDSSFLIMVYVWNE